MLFKGSCTIDCTKRPYERKIKTAFACFSGFFKSSPCTLKWHNRKTGKLKQSVPPVAIFSSWSLFFPLQNKIQLYWSPPRRNPGYSCFWMIDGRWKWKEKKQLYKIENSITMIITNYTVYTALMYRYANDYVFSRKQSFVLVTYVYVFVIRRERKRMICLHCKCYL